MFDKRLCHRKSKVLVLMVCTYFLYYCVLIGKQKNMISGSPVLDFFSVKTFKLNNWKNKNVAWLVLKIVTLSTWYLNYAAYVVFAG